MGYGEEKNGAEEKQKQGPQVGLERERRIERRLTVGMRG